MGTYLGLVAAKDGLALHNVLCHDNSWVAGSALCLVAEVVIECCALVVKLHATLQGEGADQVRGIRAAGQDEVLA